MRGSAYTILVPMGADLTAARQLLLMAAALIPAHSQAQGRVVALGIVEIPDELAFGDGASSARLERQRLGRLVRLKQSPSIELRHTRPCIDPGMARSTRGGPRRTGRPDLVRLGRLDGQRASHLRWHDRGGHSPGSMRHRRRQAAEHRRRAADTPARPGWTAWTADAAARDRARGAPRRDDYRAAHRAHRLGGGGPPAS